MARWIITTSEFYRGGESDVILSSKYLIANNIEKYFKRYYYFLKEAYTAANILDQVSSKALRDNYKGIHKVYLYRPYIYDTKHLPINNICLESICNLKRTNRYKYIERPKDYELKYTPYEILDTIEGYRIEAYEYIIYKDHIYQLCCDKCCFMYIKPHPKIASSMHVVPVEPLYVPHELYKVIYYPSDIANIDRYKYKSVSEDIKDIK